MLALRRFGKQPGRKAMQIAAAYLRLSWHTGQNVEFCVGSPSLDTRSAGP